MRPCNREGGESSLGQNPTSFRTNVARALRRTCEAATKDSCINSPRHHTTQPKNASITSTNYAEANRLLTQDHVCHIFI